MKSPKVICSVVYPLQDLLLRKGYLHQDLLDNLNQIVLAAWSALTDSNFKPDPCACHRGGTCDVSHDPATCTCIQCTTAEAKTMTSRQRILKYLSGQLKAAIDDPNPNWLWTDTAGDKLDAVGVGAARDAGRDLLEDLLALKDTRITRIKP